MPVKKISSYFDLILYSIHGDAGLDLEATVKVTRVNHAIDTDRALSYWFDWKFGKTLDVFFSDLSNFVTKLK